MVSHQNKEFEEIYLSAIAGAPRAEAEAKAEAEHKQTQNQLLEEIYISAMANPYVDSEEELDQQPEPVVPEVAPEAEVVPEVEPEDRTAQFHKHIKYIKKKGKT